jgi:hypothetical protein
MPTEKLSDRLTNLIVDLSSNEDELYVYGADPVAYLRKRDFPNDAIDAITTGNAALQALLAREGSGALNLYNVHGVKGFQPTDTRRVAKKESTAAAKKKAPPAPTKKSVSAAKKKK